MVKQVVIYLAYGALVASLGLGFIVTGAGADQRAGAAHAALRAEAAL